MKHFLPLWLLLGLGALTTQAQPDDLIVHEWGTFTTLSAPDGQLLYGLTRSEEPLPPWIYRPATRMERADKGIFMDNARAINVNARMETPVLYFYTKSMKWEPYEVNVRFRGGSVSEWYPRATKSEYYFSSNTPGITRVSQGPYDHYLVDLKDGYVGHITWNGDILPDNTTIPNTYPGGNAHWQAPRNVASNKVINHIGEIDQFLFYRGVAYLEPPLHLRFNIDNNLVLQNTGSDTIAFAMVFEQSGQSNRLLWSGNVSPQFARVVDYKVNACTDCLPLAKHLMEDELVTSGLYLDEAKALLETWENSYFKSNGLKVFWIVPRTYVDSILPVHIFPTPQNLERVFVGRSEVLTPEQALHIREFCAQGDLKATYEHDRFYNAYIDLCSRDELPLSDILQDTSFNLRKEGLWTLAVSPNPASGEITLDTDWSLTSEAIMTITDISGRVWLSSSFKAIDKELTVPITALPAGVYVAVVAGEGGVASAKFVKQ